MQANHDDGNDRGRLEKLGRSVGGLTGKAADTAAGWTGKAASAAADATGSLVNSVGRRIGGWWLDRGADEADRFDTDRERDRDCRQHFEQQTEQAASAQSYETARPLYGLGHVAAHNPEYRGRDFRDVEKEISAAWGDEQSRRYGDWSDVRSFVGGGFEHGSADARDRRDIDDASSPDAGTGSPGLDERDR
jgi:hypothetical protein